MRLTNVTISAFRGFTREVSLALDSDMILLTGSNGAGKTSFIDALFWAMTGSIPRLEAVALKTGEDYVSSRYASTLPRVIVTMKDDAGSYLIDRHGFGKSADLKISVPTGPALVGESAEQWLRDNFNPEGFGGKGFERSIILQQDEIREFLNADAKERYRYLAFLAGVEETEVLDRRMRAELKKRKDNLRDISSTLEGEESRLTALERSRSESKALLARIESAETIRQDQFVAKLASLLGTKTPWNMLELESLVARGRHYSARLESALREIGRRSQTLETAQRVLSQASPSGESSEIRARLERAESELRQAEEKSLLAQERLEETIAQEDRKRQLALLAIEQLGDRCPVCDQHFDRDHALQHLRTLLAGTSEDIPSLREEAESLRTQASGVRSELLDLRQQLAQTEQKEASAATAAETVRQEADALARAHEKLEELTGSAKGEPQALLDEVTEALQGVSATRGSYREGNVIELQVRELDIGISAQQQTVERFRRQHALLEQRVARAEQICDWLGVRLVRATTQVVKGAIPFINELYARLDIHPTLRRFDFSTERFYQAGRLQPWLYDDELEIDGNAGHLLSSAQLNVLAVCLFLAMNLTQRWSPLGVLIMDDPVQSMDDVHTLGLADTLRGIKEHRQMVISTHDPRVSDLLWRKMRPLDVGDRNIRIEFSDWSPQEGPSLKIDEAISREVAPELRVVGSEVLARAAEPGF